MYIVHIKNHCRILFIAHLFNNKWIGTAWLVWWSHHVTYKFMIPTFFKPVMLVVQPKAPLHQKGWELEKEAFLHLHGLLHTLVPLTSPIYTFNLHLESFNVLPGLQCLDDASIDPMWNNYNKVSINFHKFIVKIPSYLVVVAYECWDFELPLGAPNLKQSGFVISFPLFKYHLPFIPFFEHGHSTLGQPSIESLRISQALNSLNFGWNFVNSKYQSYEICKFELSI